MRKQQKTRPPFVPAVRLPDASLVMACTILAGAAAAGVGLHAAGADLLSMGAFFAPLAALLAMILVYGSLTGDERAMACLIGLAAVMAEAIFRKRAYADKSIDFQVLMRFGLWLLLMLPVLAALYRTRFRLIEQIGWPWIALYFWFAMSALWAPNPLYSAVAAFSACAYLFFFSAISMRYEPFLVARIVVYAIALFCLVSLFLYFAVPGFGRMPLYTTGEALSAAAPLTTRLTGFASTANSAGFIAGIGLLLGMIFWPRLRALDGSVFYAAMALCAFVLLLSQSRMSLAGVLMLGFLHRYGSLRRAHLVAFAFAGTIAVLLMLFVFEDELLPLISRSASFEELTTMTGRTSIWTVVLSLIGEKPLQGWGYASSVFVLTQYAREVGFSSISQAHNLLLQVALTSGLVGLLLFLAAAGSLLRRAYVNGSREALTLFLFILFVGLTEPGPFFGMTNAGVMALGMAIGFAGASVPQRAASSAPRRTDLRPALHAGP